ncbi:MAG: protein-L-isoaspartate O-methyltransferase [Melioribacteraceae bacterium]|nr:MAG: protein-L-isoaspartate O-methyltransferase [Melioribacteraceae bacterium]
MYNQKKNNLANELALKGIKNERLIDVFRNLDRHLFVPEYNREDAYVDQALSIGEGQTISQPYTVAVMTELLEVSTGDKVLEIGTGSGYQAAILARLGCDVFSIERIKSLRDKAGEVFNLLNLEIRQFMGDGSLGLPEEAPFDRIIVTAGTPSIPETLKKQLKNNGKIVAPVGTLDRQALVQFTKVSDTRFEVKELPGFVFVPLIGKEAWKEK